VHVKVQNGAARLIVGCRVDYPVGTLRKYMSDDKEWLHFREALEKIVRERNISPESAKNLLVQACASKVRSRYLSLLAIDAQRIQVSYREIHPSEWDGSVVPVGVVDLATGTFRAVFDDNSQGPISINAVDLNGWLARPRRGPKKGTVSRYTVSDQALFPRIALLIDDGKAASANAAALLLVQAGLVAGPGTEDSRARRLAKAYLTKTH
jgi:hypothetical protein